MYYLRTVLPFENQGTRRQRIEERLWERTWKEDKFILEINVNKKSIVLGICRYAIHDASTRLDSLVVYIPPHPFLIARLK